MNNPAFESDHVPANATRKVTPLPKPKQKKGGPVKLPKEPNNDEGGYGWVIVFCSFVINLLVLGFHYSFGVILVELLDEFQAGRGATAWVYSLLTSTTYLIGPISSAVMTVYGAKAAVISGTLLSAIGIICSAYAPNIWTLYVTIGIITGCGLGMMYLPAVVIISYYFDQKRAVATGLSACGAGVGTFAFPPLMTKLIELFGWRQSCFILAGIVMQGLVVGGLMRYEEYQPTKTKAVQSSNTFVPSEPNPATKRFSGGQAVPNGGEILPTRNILKRFQSAPTRRRLIRHPSSVNGLISLRRRQTSLHITPLQGLHDLVQPSAEQPIPTLRQQFSTIFRALWAKNLLKDGCFLAFLLGSVLWAGSYYIPFSFLPDKATSFGIPKRDAAFLVSIIGISNTIGRIFFGFLCDLPNVKERRFYLYAGSHFVCGLSTALSFHQSYTAQIVYGVIFGTALGMKTLLIAVALGDLLGLDKLAVAFGMVNLAYGLACLIGPSIGGWIYDYSQNFDVMFGSAGVVIIAAGLVLCTVPCIRAYRLKKARKELRAMRSCYVIQEKNGC